MLTGSELGEAIKSAIAKKNISQKKLAEDFGVKPPSVHGWIKTGRIDKPKFFELLRYFSDVVDATHWGLPADYSAAPHPGETQAAQGTPTTEEDAKSSAASMVLDMLKKHAGKSLNSAAQQRIAQAVADSLAEGGSPAAPSSNVIVGDFSRPVGLVGDEIRIAHYDIRGAMGNGQVPADYMEMLHDVKVSQSHLRKIGVSFEDPNHLKMVYGWGQSMEPTIKHADPLIVDISINQFNGDGIFIFTWQGHLYIKRLQVQDADHFEMISDNKRHKDRSIRMDETYIHARVLLVWNAHLV